MGNLGPTELVLILLIVIVFFGAKKIPELAQGLGKGIREFRTAARELEETSSQMKKTDCDRGGIKGLEDEVRGIQQDIRGSIKI
jgi:sec-independent protein translocase protein TatA